MSVLCKQKRQRLCAILLLAMNLMYIGKLKAKCKPYLKEMFTYYFKAIPAPHLPGHFRPPHRLQPKFPIAGTVEGSIKLVITNSEELTEFEGRPGDWSLEDILFFWKQPQPRPISAKHRYNRGHCFRVLMLALVTALRNLAQKTSLLWHSKTSNHSSTTPNNP